MTNVNLQQKATFAAGCFWGVQAAFDEMPGVLKTTVGYTGGHTAKPNYEQVCAGGTGQAEAVEVVFDPTKVSYEDLVRKFFDLHDPTTLNRQGPDVGAQYRSAIFYETDEEKSVAEKVKTELGQLGKWNAPIVTEVTAASVFWPAEDYHQKYFAKNGGGSCHI